jgi:hypothetical protein
MIRNTLTIFLLIGSLLAGAEAMAIEEPEYEVLGVSGDVEFRRYAPYIVAEVTVSGDSADRRAFQLLAGYIFGKNDAGEKMSMTAPVETRGDEYAFVMERKYSMDTLPRPEDERVQLRNKAARDVAVRRYSGRWSERNFDRHRQALLDDLAELGVEVTGTPELARYNSPFTPWFLRRNEIIVPIDWASVGNADAVASGPSSRL